MKRWTFSQKLDNFLIFLLSCDKTSLHFKTNKKILNKFAVGNKSVMNE
jgi:hypothetical protein